MTTRWGFIGAGFVASRAMAPAVHAATGAQLYAVASRDPRRSESLEPVVVHATYTDLLQDDAVDAVYISLANHQHVEWVTRALRAGKHVLCEKPLGVCASDVMDMYAVADETKKSLIEATWVRWHPRFRRLMEVVQFGDLGEVQHVESAFTSWREASSLRIGETEETFAPVDAFVEMTEHVSAFINDGSGWVFAAEDTRRVAQIMDDIATHPSTEAAI